jgi:hypothetical protein
MIMELGMVRTKIESAIVALQQARSYLEDRSSSGREINKLRKRNDALEKTVRGLRKQLSDERKLSINQRAEWDAMKLRYASRGISVTRTGKLIFSDRVES